MGSSGICLFYSSNFVDNYCFFSCIQTIAVIPVLPHGVVQLGSYKVVSSFYCICSECMINLSVDAHGPADFLK